MKKILIVFLFALFTTFTSCSPTPSDPENFDANYMRCVNGHIYLYKHDQNGYLYLEHDTVSCPRCNEIRKRFSETKTDSCLVITIYNI